MPKQKEERFVRYKVTTKEHSRAARPTLTSRVRSVAQTAFDDAVRNGWFAEFSGSPDVLGDNWETIQSYSPLGTATVTDYEPDNEED